MEPRRIAFPATVILGLFIALNALNAWAHHATAVEYDIAKTITLKGVIAKVDWANPHIHVRMEVKTEKGVENWDIEFGSPGAAIVAGIARDSLKPGAELTITGYPERSQPATGKAHTACAVEVTLPDGLKTKFVVGI